MNGFVGMDPEVVRAVGNELKAAGDRLAHLRSEVDLTVRRALHGWQGPDLEVFHQGWVQSHQVSLVAAAAAITGLGQSLLNNVSEQEDVSAALAGGAGGALAAGAAGTGSIGAGPPCTEDTTKIAAWWNALSDADKAKVLREHPEWLGNADGIPGSVRDQANRALIPRYEEQLLARQADLLGDPAGNRHELAVIRGKLEGLQALSLLPEDRQILSVDISGREQLMAAVANGNVDTADHIAVVSPGFTTTVAGGIADADGANAQLKGVMEQQLRRHGEDGSVAVVTWFGYEAPQWGNVVDPSQSVLNDNLAREGGDRLASFYNGLDAMRDRDAHITALGHSYGSTTTGYALQHQTGVDDVVFYGSPGIGTDDVSDLKLPDGHVYYIETGNDPVGDAAAFGADPSGIKGVHQLSAGESTRDGSSYSGSGGHSEYLKNGSTSQYNIASVATGHSGDTVANTGYDISVGGAVHNVGNAVADGARNVANAAKDTAADIGNFVKRGLRL